MIVYSATSKNGLTYIGATSRSLRTRIVEHRSNAAQGKPGKFYDEIRKNKIDFFEFEILKHCSSVDQMFNYEKAYIEYFDSYNCGLNSSMGGHENTRLHFTKKQFEAFRAGGIKSIYDGRLKKAWEKSLTSENQKIKSQKSHAKKNAKMPWYLVFDEGVLIGKFRGYKDASAKFNTTPQAWRSYVMRGKFKNFLIKMEQTHGE
jgi:hypothetical protein